MLTVGYETVVALTKLLFDLRYCPQPDLILPLQHLRQSLKVLMFVLNVTGLLQAMCSENVGAGTIQKRFLNNLPMVLQDPNGPGDGKISPQAFQRLGMEAGQDRILMDMTNMEPRHAAQVFLPET